MGLFTPLTTGLFDDRWYTSSRPLYFYQKDIIDGTIMKKQSALNPGMYSPNMLSLLQRNIYI